MIELITGTVANLLQPLHSAHGLVVFCFTIIGGACTIAGACARTMVPLRRLTVASNFAFLVSAYLAPNPALLVLYCSLFLLNVYRLIEIMRLTEQVTQAANNADLSGVWLKPYMKSRHVKAGVVLFKKGDKADQLYFLAEGSIELVEIGKTLPAGQLFGEISFFSPAQKRTQTARCVTDCVVLRIAESTFNQLYFQNPKFAFLIANLITRRLGSDIQRLEDKIAQAQAARVTGT